MNAGSLTIGDATMMAISPPGRSLFQLSQKKIRSFLIHPPRSTSGNVSPNAEVVRDVDTSPNGGLPTTVPYFRFPKIEPRCSVSKTSVRKTVCGPPSRRKAEAYCGVHSTAVNLAFGKLRRRGRSRAPRPAPSSRTSDTGLVKSPATADARALGVKNCPNSSWSEVAFLYRMPDYYVSGRFRQSVGPWERNDAIGPSL